MKKKRFTLFGLNAVILFYLLIPANVIAQLSGSYTINPTISASNSNYQNWASAIGDLLSGSRTDGGNAQGSGVNGPVTFTVYDTVYNNTAIEITAITGASSSNTITFRSQRGDSSRCVLRNPSSSSTTADYVLYLNGADYITFRQIGFDRTGSNTYCTVIQIGNDADNNRFIRCQVKGRKMPSSSSLGFTYGIGSCFYFTGNADYTEITQNRLLYGYNGIYCASSCTNNTISRNVLDTSGSSGIYMTQQNVLMINGNDFRMGDFGPNQGHYTSYGMRIESSPAMRIINNKVRMLTVNAQVVRAVIIASTTSSAANPTLVYNNWILNSGGTGDCTGLAVYACNYLNFYYNNVLINSSISTGSAYYHYPQYSNTYIRLMNNNLINKGTGYAISVSGTNTGDLDSVDYNNIYSAGTYLGIWNATNYSALSAWKSGTGKDANSLNIDPGYQSSSDLHVSNIGLNGKALRSLWVTDDIDGELRDTTAPDIGADEFFPVARDVGINSLDSPIVFSSGTHNVKVRFQNYGFDTVKSVQIHWQVNSTTQTTYNWTGNVAPGASSASINIGSYSFSSNTPYSFKIWTRNPNNLSDGKTGNDTLKITRMAGLTGTYSLGDTAGTDFKSFNDIINAISARGISGSVTVNVRPGIYNEQITLLQLPGMGASNPIVFKNTSSDSSRVLITLPSTVATGNNNAVLQLRGADYVTFHGITFQRTGTNPYATVIHILNGSNHNTFSHCQMIGQRVASVSPSAMNILSDAGQDEYNTFRNNYIKLGTVNMQYNATAIARETGNVVEGNTFDSAYQTSVQISYNDGIKLKNNTFRSVISAVSGNYQIQLLDCDNAIQAEANKFTGVNTESALFLKRCDATQNNPGLIFNNMITKNSGKGIHLDSCNYQNIVFNSIYFNGSSGSNAGVYNTGSGSGDLVLKNNNIYMVGGDVVFFISSAAVSASNYNNFYSRGSQFAYWGSACNDLAGLQSINGKDQNSLSLDPFFTSPFDLHIINPLMKGSGTPVNGVTVDMDGEPRDYLTPDIGADEFRLADNDAGITELYKPIAASCAGLHQIEVVIRNFGGDTLTGALIRWTIAGNPQTPFNWSGSLLPKQNDTFVIGNFNFLTALNPKFVIWSELPNGQTDAIRFNDTFTGNRSMRSLPSANAGSDQTICAGTAVTIGQTPVNGVSYVWNDIDNQYQVGTSSRITVSPPVQTTYELIATNITFGCSKRDTVTIRVNPVPVANAGTDKTICFGNTVQLGVAPQSGFTYTWTSVPSGYSSSAANPLVSPNQSTMFILQKSFTNSGCSDLDTVMVNVSLPPTPTIQGDAELCLGVSKTYSTAFKAGNTYKWNVNNGQILSGQFLSAVSVKWVTSGNALLQLIETNASSCSDTVTYNVIVNPAPVADFASTEVCKGVTTVFTDSSSDAVNYKWSFGDGNSSTQKNPQHLYTQAGSYNVMLIVTSNKLCVDTTVGVAYVNPVPIAGFKYSKNQLTEFTFTDTSSDGGGNIVSWSWDFGDGNVSSQQNPVHTYTSQTTYTVTLCVKSDRNCEHCSSMTITAVGLDEHEYSSVLNLYPNPGSGFYTLESAGSLINVTVLNLQGQVLKTYTPGADSLNLELGDLADGVYMLRVESGGSMYLLKLIKTL